MNLQTTGRYFNFLKPSNSSGLTPSETIIIEKNIGKQINVLQNYSKTTLDAKGLPTLIEIYEDDTMSKKLWTITTTFADGKPTQTIKVNEDDGTTQTINYTFTTNNIEVRKV